MIDDLPRPGRTPHDLVWDSQRDEEGRVIIRAWGLARYVLQDAGLNSLVVELLRQAAPGYVLDVLNAELTLECSPDPAHVE